MKLIFDWIANKLKVNSLYEFHIFTGASLESLISQGYPLDFFWTHPQTQALLNYKNQITIHYNLGWNQVLNIYSKTKLMISSLRGGSFTAGAAQESAMYGIPFILTLEDSLSTGTWQETLSSCSASFGSQLYLDLMDKLLEDELFYNLISKSISNAVYHYTYKSFNDNIISALQKRGMI